MSVDHFFWLDQIQPHHRDRVGSKAFYLALLLQRGYPVAPGVVVSSDLFQTFLRQIEWTDPMFADLPASSLYLDVDNPRQLQTAAQQIRQAIVSTPFPESWSPPLKLAVEDWQTEAVILRPSFSLVSGLDPTVSLQTKGLLDAKICSTEAETIAQTLKQVWAELFRARSLLYWQRLGIQPQQIQLAVLVQPIRSAIASGEAIVRGSELEIRAVWGLGHGIAQGIAPDTYRVDAAGNVQVDRVSRKTISYKIAVSTSAQATQSSSPFGISEQEDCLQMQMLQQEQQTQPALNQAQVERLAHLCRQITLTLDLTVELEWTLHALTDSSEPRFYITQIIPYSSRTSKASSPVPAASSPPEANPHCSIGETDSHRFKGIAAAPGSITARVWVMPEASAALRGMPPGCVLVAPMILPEWVSQLYQVAGIVTEQGGATSHGAILARELGIPAVVGVAEAMQVLHTGERVMVNGDRGEVMRVISEQVASERSEFDPEASHAEPLNSEPLNSEPLEQPQAGSLPMHSADCNDCSANPRTDNSRTGTLTRRGNLSRSMPVTATRLMVSLSQSESIDRSCELPIDGVGLLRSELLWLKSLDNRSPEEWLPQDKSGLIDRLAQQIQPFVDRMMPNPVFYRSLDIRAHEFPLLAASSPAEANPMLGLRGTYRYQINPAWFEVELAALRQVQQAGYDNLRLILPFVRTVEEFIFCRDRVRQAGLHQPSVGESSFELWIMAEVPSVLLLLTDYIEAGVQGMAIGCNDLTQLLLGVDRDHPQMAAQFSMTHPAVMQAIQQIIQTCRSARLPCTVCGQLPQRLDVIDRLVEWGVTGISVEPGDVAWMGQAIDRAERRVMLEKIRHAEG